MTQLRFEHFEQDGLTPAEEEIFTLVEVDGLEPHEAAFETGRTASTARTLLMRARRKKNIAVSGSSEGQYA